jgi:hypothetical protein
MKSISIVTTMVVIVLFSLNSCVRQELISPPTFNQGEIIQSAVNFEVLGLKTTKVPGDTTIYVEQGTQLTLKAFASGPSIVSWSWRFLDDNLVASGELTSHAFNSGSTTTTCLVIIRGADSAGKVYERTRKIISLAKIDYVQGVQCLTSIKYTETSFGVVLAVNKSGMNSVAKQYAYTGNVMDSPWSGSVVIAPADTNYNVIAGVATAVTNAYGKYVLIRLSLRKSEFEYQMGIGKINVNTLIWGQFWGPFVSTQNNSLIKFSISTDGKVIPKGTS